MASPTPDHHALFPSLSYDRPAEGVLRVTLDTAGPHASSLTPSNHTGS
ncbi:MAG: hypothetical protein Q7V88_17035 [Actinomycetota bacterium]|nr:hypothetical protein [Actinomycetota bacterium]